MGGYADFRLFEKTQKGKSKDYIDIYPTINKLGDFKTLENKNAIINSVRNLLYTPLGRYPFDPTFGSMLYKQLFEFSDSTTEEIIRYEVTDRVEVYEPRIKVTSCIIDWDRPNKVCQISVYLKFKNETMDPVKLDLIFRGSGVEMFSTMDESTND